jgi:DNA-binding FrmR family transcriptional regulator
MAEFTNAMQKMQFEALVEMINEHNALVGKINAVTGNKDALEENIRESDEFATIREQIATLQDQFDAAVKAKVEAALAEAKDGGDTESDAAKAKELKNTIGAGQSYYKKLYGDAAAEDFPKVDRIKGTRASGGGAGGRRVRGYNVIVTENGESDEYENFATAAKALGLATTDLQEQFFAKAGVEKLKDAPETVEFEVSWTEVDEDGNESEASAHIKAYRTGESGVPTKSEDASPTATVDEGDLATI